MENKEEKTKLLVELSKEKDCLDKYVLIDLATIKDMIQWEKVLCFTEKGTRVIEYFKEQEKKK